MSAVKSEALNESTVFEFDGEVYEIPSLLDADLDVMEAFEEGKVVAATRALLGPVGWARFRSKPRTGADLQALFEAMAEALGLGNR